MNIEKIYDVLERESSKGRFKTCLRHVLVWSFISMQLYVEQQIKEGKLKKSITAYCNTLPAENRMGFKVEVLPKK